MKLDDVESGVSVDSAGKSFGSRLLWRGVSFEAPAGTMTALRGHSGSGKTTLLNSIGGLASLDQGAIRVNGLDVGRLSRRGSRKMRRDVLGFLFQNFALMENERVSRNLSVVKPRRIGARIPQSEMRSALNRVGLDDGFLNRRVSELSGGERQRVAIARLLLKRPPVILADEPTGSLDDDNAAGIVDLLKALAADGAAIILATHDSTVANSCECVVDLDSYSEEVDSGNLRRLA